jgi:hypothetical protein
MSDASIPLRINVPQIESSLDAQIRGLKMQDLAQGVELNQQQIAARRQQAKDAADDRAAMGTIQNEFMANDGDYDKTRKALLGKVNLKHIQQFDNDHLTQQRSALALSEEQRRAYQASTEAVAQEAAKLMELPPEKRGPAALQAVGRLKKIGADVSGIQFDPATGPSDDELKAAIVGSKYHGQMLTWSEKESQAKLRDQQAQVAAQEQAAKDKTRMMEDAARSHLGVTNQEEHNEWLAGLDPKIAPLFKNLKKFTPDSQAAIQGIPMTTSQRQAQATKDEAAATNAEYKKTMASVAESRAAVYDMIGQARQLTAEAMMLRAEAAGNKKPGDDASVRQARTQYQALSAAEGKLNTLRYAIGAAAKAKVDADGKPISGMYKTPRDFEAEMKAATEELSRVITEKYDAAIRAGMGEPKIPLEQALREIQAGATPQPKQAPPPAAKTQTPAVAAPPSAPTAATPPASRSAQGTRQKPPDQVVKALRPGIYTFANGETWQKNPDGTLVPVENK